MQIEVIKNIEQLDKNQWNALAQLTPAHTIFQTYEFNHAASQVYGQAGQGFILTLKDAGRLIAIFPLMILNIKGKKILQFMAGERSDYCNIICPKEQEKVLDLFWQYIFDHNKDWDEIQLGNITLGTPLAGYILVNKKFKRLCHRSSQDEAVYLQFSKDQAYTKAVMNKKRIITYRNSFQKSGSYRVVHLTDSHDIQACLEDFFSQHIQRWQNTQFPSLFLEEKNKQFYRQLVQGLPKGWISFTVIYLDQHVLAYHFGFSYGKNFMWYKPTYNVAFSGRSPGQILLQEVLEYAYSRNFEEFDFGVGKDPYKYRFGNEIRHNNSFRIFASHKDYFYYYVPIAIKWRLQHLCR